MCMKIIKIFPIILSLLILSGCYTILDKNKIGNEAEIKPILDRNVFLPDSAFRTENYYIKYLHQSWVNVNESSNEIIWKPKKLAGSPRRRFRENIIFNKNGEYSVLRLSPTDAHYFEKLRWRLSKENNNEILIYNSNGKKNESKIIEKLDSVSLVFQSNE